MSLHIGNLSAGIHIDDLQRVFRRFGRCNIRVKDKYGFVVYDYPASAEKAIKTLRGTRICGQAITVSWSKQQPRSLQRLHTRDKLNEQPPRRYPVKAHANQRLGPYDLRKNEMNSHKADGELKTGSSNLIESLGYGPGDSKSYARGKSHTSLNDHGIEGGRKNRVNVSRWDEQTVDPLNEDYLDTNLDFDRYEPHNSDSKKDLDEHIESSPLVDSPSARKIKDGKGHSNNEQSQKSCYLCAEAGHESSNCPLESKRHMSGSQGRKHPSVETVPFSSQDSDREPSTSKGHHRLVRHRDSSTQEVSPGGRAKELKDRKRSKRDHESQEKSRFERARDPSSSPPTHSDYTTSRSQSPSRSLRSFSQPSSRFKLKSVPLKKVPLRSSRESSPSSHSGYKTFKSRSKAGSVSPISSLLPKEVNQSVSYSPDKVQEDFNGSLANDVDLHPSTNLFDEETQIRRSAGAIRLDGDDHIADNLPLDSLKGIKDAPNEQCVGATTANISVKSNASGSLRMSSEEVNMVLKHYGLQPPEENEIDLPLEVYFGSARLWPWEMIYYRRLKKGTISAENYSRRIAQNAEFGIVDRHVRGSSGWGEFHENNS